MHVLTASWSSQSPNRIEEVVVVVVEYNRIVAVVVVVVEYSRIEEEEVVMVVVEYNRIVWR